MFVFVFRRSGSPLRRLAAMPRATPHRADVCPMRPAERNAFVISTSAPGSQRQQRGPNCGVLEDSASDKTMLERNGSFHVRPAVIDGARHREQPVMDRACLRVVFGLAGSDQLDERFGCKASISHQAPSTSNIVCSRYSSWQVRICRFGTLTADDRDLACPTGACCARRSSWRTRPAAPRCRVGSRGCTSPWCRVRILKQDQRQTALLVDRAVAVLRRALLIAEAQPAM